MSEHTNFCTYGIALSRSSITSLDNGHNDDRIKRIFVYKRIFSANHGFGTVVELEDNDLEYGSYFECMYSGLLIIRTMGLGTKIVAIYKDKQIGSGQTNYIVAHTHSSAQSVIALPVTKGVVFANKIELTDTEKTQLQEPRTDGPAIWYRLVTNYTTGFPN